MSQTVGRREFLERAGMGAAAMVAAGCATTAAGFGANETINVGCIGTGGRCRHLMNVLNTIPNTRITAVCDVWDAHLEEGRKLADAKAFVTKRHEELLERRDVDAVIIGTPDHLHVPLTIDAVAAGKDVYVEKPLTHDIAEGQTIIDAVNRSGQIVQVGMQQRSMPHLMEAKQLIDRGEAGPIRKVHLTWNRNWNRGGGGVPDISPDTVDWKRFLGDAPDQPFDPYRFRNWRFFWDFGGGIFTDLMVHFVDVAHWFTGVDHPALATSIGNHFTHEDVWDTPDTVQTLLQYPDPETQIYFEGTFFNARNAAMMEFMGSDATVYCDRGRYELHPEPGRDIPYKELVLGSGGKGQDFYDAPNGELLHLTNWLDSVRTRQRPVCPAEYGVQAANAAHLANKALRSGQVARWQA